MFQLCVHAENSDRFHVYEPTSPRWHRYHHNYRLSMSYEILNDENIFLIPLAKRLAIHWCRMTDNALLTGMLILAWTHSDIPLDICVTCMRYIKFVCSLFIKTLLSMRTCICFVYHNTPWLATRWADQLYQTAPWYSECEAQNAPIIRCTSDHTCSILIEENVQLLLFGAYIRPGWRFLDARVL